MEHRIIAIAATISAISRCCRAMASHCMFTSRRANAPHAPTDAPSKTESTPMAMILRSILPPYTAKLCSPMVSRTSRDQIHDEVAVDGL